MLIWRVYRRVLATLTNISAGPIVVLI